MHAGPGYRDVMSVGMGIVFGMEKIRLLIELLTNSPMGKLYQNDTVLEKTCCMSVTPATIQNVVIRRIYGWEQHCKIVAIA
jgi:hypothetical protein